MSNNTKIFSEAIAEAKAIRETAMANAKLALEEAFAPRIQEMMSNKLEALAEDDMNEDIGQAIADAGMDDGMDAGMDVTNEEISLEELLAELEGLEEGADKDADDKKMEENTIAEAEADDEVGTISVDELKDIIRDIMADVMGGGEEEEAGEEEVEAGEEEMEASEDDLELEEILAEIANLEEGDEEENLEEWGSGAAAGNFSGYDDEGDIARWIKAAAAKAKMTVQNYLKSKGITSVNEEENLEEWGSGAAAGNFSGYDDEGDLARWIKKAAAKLSKFIKR
jgi:hypothetical protein